MKCVRPPLGWHSDSMAMFQETQFSVKAEASSPGAAHMGDEQDASPSKLSKEELIQSMDRVDREIAKVEQQIFKLKKKQVGPQSAEARLSVWATCEIPTLWFPISLF